MLHSQRNMPQTVWYTSANVIYLRLCHIPQTMWYTSDYVIYLSMCDICQPMRYSSNYCSISCGQHPHLKIINDEYCKIVGSHAWGRSKFHEVFLPCGNVTRLGAWWNPHANHNKWHTTCILHGHGFYLLYHRCYYNHLPVKYTEYITLCICVLSWQLDDLTHLFAFILQNLV